MEANPFLTSRLEREFRRFHKDNPHVYSRLVEMATELQRRGRKKIGIGMLFEVLRWEYYMETDDPYSDFKLNNNYRSYYARKIMEDRPDLAGIFETRQLRAA